MSEFYSHTTYPANGSSLSSAAMRAELDAIEAGFDKMPALAGQGDKMVSVKTDGSGLESISAATARSRMSVSSTTESNNYAIAMAIALG